MIIFNSKETQKTLPIYRMNLHCDALLIEHNGKTVSISTNSELQESKQLFTDAVSAFLRTNPSGFGDITHAMLEGYKTPRFGFYFCKDLLTNMEYISNRLSHTLLDPSPLFYPFYDFRSGAHFPTLYISDYIPDWVPSYRPPVTQYWVLEMTPDNLIKVNLYMDENRVLVYSCTPDTEKNERLLDIRTFIDAIRVFVNLDQAGFVKAFETIKAQYDKMSPACNMHYYQLCLMADVYSHFDQDIQQAAHFCPWIDYD